MDRFAPPGAEAADIVVELADDELERKARKRRSVPHMAPPEAVDRPSHTSGPEPAARRSAPSLSPPPAELPAASRPSHGSATMPAVPAPMTPVLAMHPRPAPGVPRTRLATHHMLGSPRWRFAAGILLAIVLGFIPAHVVASIQEDRAFRPIDARVVAAQVAVDTMRGYDALDALRADQLDAKQSAQRRIIATSMLLWFAAAGALGYVWFRRVPWDR